MRGWVLAVALWSAVGCGEDEKRVHGPADNPTVVTDVTGVEFAWNCDAQGCKAAQAPSTPPPNDCGDRTPGYSYTWGRFIEVCSVCLSDSPGIHWSTSPGDCRVLACNDDRDCPLIYEDSPESIYECSNGLCQNTDVNQFPRDSVTQAQATQLCYAPHPRTETADPYSQTSLDVRAAVDAACPNVAPTDACPLPAGCRTP